MLRRVLLPSALVTGTPALAQTAAGVRIDNTATLRFDQDGIARQTASNTARLVVAERLDVALHLLAVAPDAAGHAVARVTLDNAGNGQEAFGLALAGPASARLFVDTDGDGRLGAGDTALAGQTPALATGGRLALLIVADAGATDVRLTAQALTGHGAPGTVFAGQGDDGADAVVGPTGASATVTFATSAGAAGEPPRVTKRQEVRAPDGSATPIAGAIVTYTIEAHFPAAVAGARLIDALPAGLRLVPGSVALDGAPLADADAIAGSTVSVALGEVEAGATHLLRFKTSIE